jgi:beta-N-acetylhexosaminidase
MAFGAAGNPDYAEQFGRITAIEARAIGVRWNWFPDADVNSNPANPVINTRAFSGDAQQVSQLVAAYIKGARAAGMMTTAKHFPGHGDTETDSHLGLARVGGDLQRLHSTELPPFRAAIAAGVDSVMVAHVTAPAFEPAPDRVASNSPAIVTGLLRNQLGFTGIIVTDALDMNGLMRMYTAPGVNPSARAAVETVKAGNDMVIIPADLDGAYRGLLQAVRSGELAETQIDASVLRILRAKASVGLHKSRLVDLEALPKLVGSPENKAVAQQVADAAVTLVRDNAPLLPLKPSKGTSGTPNPYTRVVEARNRVVAVVFTDDVRSEYGRALERQLRARVPDANVLYVDLNSAEFVAAPVLATVENAERVVVALFLAPQPGRRTMINGVASNPMSLQGAQRTLLQEILQRAGERTIAVALGNPYIVTDYPTMQTYLCTFSNAPVSETSAVKALFGEIPLRGRLPVDIPGIARRGDGIERARAALQGGSGYAEKSRASAGR